MRLYRLATRCAVALATTIAAVRPAHAIPAFARMHSASCSLCHDPIPRLTPFGQAFLGNGYRFAPRQSAPDVAPTGDPLLQLPDKLRLALRLDAFLVAYTGADAATDLQTPYNLKIMSGGPIAADFSYYVYFMLSEKGETGGIEDAWVTWSDVAGLPIGLTIGQFGVADPIFPRELRLEVQDYAIYRVRVGDTPANLAYDRGLMFGADVLGFGLTTGIVNGNGTAPPSSTRRFDNDGNKSLLLHVNREVGGPTLGLLGYTAKQSGAAPGGPSVVNELWMLGVDATVRVSLVEFRAQFVHREDASPTFTSGEPRAVTNGGFVEAIVQRPGARWYAVALYNLIDANRPLLDLGLAGDVRVSRYQALTGGGGYLVQRNVRLYGEATWDMETSQARWTLGLTTAF